MNDKTLVERIRNRTAKPDPLVEAVNDLYGVFNEGSGPVDATDYFREALAKRGLKIVEV